MDLNEAVSIKQKIEDIEDTYNTKRNEIPATRPTKTEHELRLKGG